MTSKYYLPIQVDLLKEGNNSQKLNQSMGIFFKGCEQGEKKTSLAIIIVFFIVYS